MCSAGFESLSASLEVDQTQVNRLLLELVRIGETHGIKFPREFGLFLKQLLYFDRYTRILAPQLKVFEDDRISWKGDEEQVSSSRAWSSSSSSNSSGVVEVLPPTGRRRQQL
jgi:predicted unusual protein kinase regulating ubiquinone biosynthesis (AarF/ABC1/UbiB family)